MRKHSYFSTILLFKTHQATSHEFQYYLSDIKYEIDIFAQICKH